MALLMVPVGFEHGKYQADLIVVCRKIYDAVEWTGPVTLNFEDKTNPEPDIIGWKNGSPFIVIEIAKTTQKADFGYKKAAYEANEIPFYVVVDIKEGNISTFGLKDGIYQASPEFLQPLERYSLSDQKPPNG